MHIDPYHNSQPVCDIAKLNSTPPPNLSWVKPRDELPDRGDIVLVWDGKFIYYATYWERQNRKFWMVADHTGIDIDNDPHRKKAGEQIYPTHWLQIDKISRI